MNENIKDFSISNFIDSQISPHFAILLRGKWGCGKTYLINQILDDVFEEDKRTCYLYQLIWHFNIKPVTL